VTQFLQYLHAGLEYLCRHPNDIGNGSALMKVLALPRSAPHFDSLGAEDFVQPCQRRLPLFRFSRHPFEKFRAGDFRPGSE